MESEPVSKPTRLPKRNAAAWPAPTLGPGATVLIVGAGEAGMAAAAKLRDEGFEGRVLLYGEEEGLPYERPPLSKQQLKADGVLDALIRPPGWFEEARIEFFGGRAATAVDTCRRIVRFADGGSERYDALLLTTGARVRRLDNSPRGVLYLRTREDAHRLRSRLRAARSLVVIGGGVIGLEVASTARELGLSVTVVDPACRLMQRALAPEISALLAQLHRAAGISLALDSGPIRVEENGGGKARVVLQGETLEAELCVAGIGIVPNDDLARSAGCAVDNGVVVDGSGRTSIPNVYAAGDVAAFHHRLFERSLRIEAWQHACRHGAHVARAMLGLDDEYLEVPWFWTDQLGVNIQCAGLAADTDFTVWRGRVDAGTAFHFASGVLRGVTTIDNGREMRPSMKLVAAGWAGDASVLADTSRPLSRIVAEHTAALQPA